MTPDDVTHIKADVAAGGVTAAWYDRRLLALCDALEAAWAERDAERAARHQMINEANELEERAERAEARNAEIQVWIDFATKWAIDPTADARALDRVRALCDFLDNEPCQCCGKTDCSIACSMDSNHGFASADDIRAAIEGANQ